MTKIFGYLLCAVVEYSLARGKFDTASRNERCVSVRRCKSSFQASSLSVSGRLNQLLPLRGKEPRFSFNSRRRTVYFQYAQWTAISQMLCRCIDGRHAASSAVSLRKEPLKFVPCHVFRSNASSSNERSSVMSFLATFLSFQKLNRLIQELPRDAKFHRTIKHRIIRRSEISCIRQVLPHQVYMCAPQPGNKKSVDG